MLSPYRIQPNINNKASKNLSNTNLDNKSHREQDLKRSQLTPNDLVKPDTNTESIIKRTSNKRNKFILTAGSMHENIEIIGKNIDEIVHKNIEMEVAMQIISNDKTGRSDTVQDLKEFNNRSLSTPSKKGEKRRTVCLYDACF